jgi:hypothetical protein
MRERETVKQRKNYLPALLLTIFFWMLWGVIVWWVDPTVIADFPIRGSYFIFFLVGFFSLLFLMSLLLANKRRGLLMAGGLVFFGYLRLWKMDSWLNLLLMFILMIGLEIYYGSKNKNLETEKQIV